MTEGVEGYGEERGVPEAIEAARPTAPLRWLTVEIVFFILIALVAGALRFYRLGARPLEESEAAQALAAWRFYQGQAEDLAGYSPFLLFSNALSFLLLGANDLTARWAPALMGTALVILPYGLRHHLGRGGTLMTSLLLALSPSTLFFSRYLGSEIIVTTCALAMVVGLFGYLEERRPLYLYVGLVALALSLSGGRTAYTMVFVFGTFFFFLALGERFGRADEAWATVADAWRTVRGEKGGWRGYIIFFAVLFVLLCTAFLTNFGGLQAGIDLFPAWLRQFAPQAAEQSWYYHFQLLITYEPLILVFGLIGLGFYLGRRELFTAFLTYWFVVTLYLYAMAPGRTPGDITLVLLPLTILAGDLLGRLLEGLVERASWGREGLFLTFASPVLVYLLFQLSSYAASGRSAYLLLVIVAFFLPLGLVALYWIWFGQGVALRGGGLTLLLILGFLTLGFGWGLNFRHEGDPREIMAATPTSPDVLNLLGTLERFSSEREGDKHVVAITVDEATGPVLAWYLRDFRNAHFVTDPGSSTDTPAVITLAREIAPALAEGYGGQDFLLRSSWRLEGLSGADLARWFLYRQAMTPVQTSKVILWVKSP